MCNSIAQEVTQWGILFSLNLLKISFPAYKEQKEKALLFSPKLKQNTEAAVGETQKIP